MANVERYFDYNGMTNHYNKMNEIIGDPGDASSVCGVLKNIDDKYKELVAVEDKALYGDLGSQLLLDWENVSSNFNSFIEKFNSWSSMVSYANGEYQKFESDVAAYNAANKYGVGTAGMTGNFIETSNYAAFTQDAYNSAYSQVRDYWDLYNINYGGFDTNQVAAEKARKTAAMISFGLNAVAFLMAANTIGSTIAGALSASAGSLGAEMGANAASSAGTLGAEMGTNAASSAGATIGDVLDASGNVILTAEEQMAQAGVNTVKYTAGVLDDLTRLGLGDSAAVDALAKAGAAGWSVSSNGVFTFYNAAGQVLRTGVVAPDIMATVFSDLGAAAGATAAGTSTALVPVIADAAAGAGTALINVGAAGAGAAGAGTALVPAAAEAGTALINVGAAGAAGAGTALVPAAAGAAEAGTALINVGAAGAGAAGAAGGAAAGAAAFGKYAPQAIGSAVASMAGSSGDNKYTEFVAPTAPADGLRTPGVGYNPHGNNVSIPNISNSGNGSLQNNGVTPNNPSGGSSNPLNVPTYGNNNQGNATGTQPGNSGVIAGAQNGTTPGNSGVTAGTQNGTTPGNSTVPGSAQGNVAAGNGPSVAQLPATSDNGASVTQLPATGESPSVMQLPAYGQNQGASGNAGTTVEAPGYKFEGTPDHPVITANMIASSSESTLTVGNLDYLYYGSYDNGKGQLYHLYSGDNGRMYYTTQNIGDGILSSISNGDLKPLSVEYRDKQNNRYSDVATIDSIKESQHFDAGVPYITIGNDSFNYKDVDSQNYKFKNGVYVYNKFDSNDDLR